MTDVPLRMERRLSFTTVVHVNSAFLGSHPGEVDGTAYRERYYTT